MFCIHIRLHNSVKKCRALTALARVLPLGRISLQQRTCERSADNPVSITDDSDSAAAISLICKSSASQWKPRGNCSWPCHLFITKGVRVSGCSKASDGFSYSSNLLVQILQRFSRRMHVMQAGRPSACSHVVDASLSTGEHLTPCDYFDRGPLSAQIVSNMSCIRFFVCFSILRCSKLGSLARQASQALREPLCTPCLKAGRIQKPLQQKKLNQFERKLILAVSSVLRDPLAVCPGKDTWAPRQRVPHTAHTAATQPSRTPCRSSSYPGRAA